MKASGSASGKVILLGEHMVVYGAPALAAGIDRGARAEAMLLPKGSESLLYLEGAAIPADPSSSDDRARAFAALLAEGAALPAVQVNAESDLPPGGGLGSSAALGVAIARAVTALQAELSAPSTPPGAAEPPAALPREPEALARASAWERVFHGNPSGIDTAAAATGRCFRFSRKDGIEPIAPARDLWLCIGWSGASASTRDMVEGVAKLRARKPDLVEHTLVGITALVENAKLAIKAGDLTALGRLMDLNQMLLAGLMVSTERIEELCMLAREAGALGAKLTGKGGGGSVIALVGAPEASADEATFASRAAERVQFAWKNAGFSGFSTRIRKRNATP
jgi:mevalonate kinase